MFQKYFDAFATLGEMLVANPLGTGSLLAIGLLLVTLKWRWISKAQRDAIRRNYAGWREEASDGAVRHETGIGTRGIKVMKPVGFMKIGLLNAILWGGGAVFYATVVLQNPQEPMKDWLVFAGCCVGTVAGLWLFAMSATRIRFDAESISRTSLFSRRFEAKLERLQDVRPLSKTLLGGAILDFGDGQVLKVRSQFSGYQDLLQLLAQRDPKLALMLRMIRGSVERAI